MNVEALSRWYEAEARDLPWRATSDPWAILLSEVLLQQTQVARGVAYWRRLLDRFPTVASMAEAELDEVMHLWQGAGYYARGRRLHALAVEVCDPQGPWQGVLPSPSTCDDVVSGFQSLPGIGPYTAAAVAWRRSRMTCPPRWSTGTFAGSWLVRPVCTNLRLQT